ncbi:MAG: hypothetical protein J5859_01510, partial [Clostridia bacterium]|nr:hypothetical protein [Clostridia bacterium]
IRVKLDDLCRDQQVSEGWFAARKEVPEYAISMSVWQIMQCKAIISAVPHKEKAWAVAAALRSPLTNRIPATMLKTHRDFSLYVDAESYADAGEITSLEGETVTEDHRADQ